MPGGILDPSLGMLLKLDAYSLRPTDGGLVLKVVILALAVNLAGIYSFSLDRR